MHTTRDNYCASHAVLAEGTNANTFKTTAAVDYVINGVGYTKAATDNLTFTAGTALAAKQQCVFFVLIDSAGTVTTAQSEIRSASTEADYVAKTISWPLNVSHTVIGAIKVVCNNAATFTPGSTDLGATDVVDTYFNVVGDYSKPILL